jgi:nicotinic acid phosphoribosyltransferase
MEHKLLRDDILNPLLTDFYQFTMIYAHWKNNRHSEHAVFDLYFRKCPFDNVKLSSYSMSFSPVLKSALIF